jgi:Rrf2 family protein
MFELASNQKHEPMFLKDIASRQDISEKYLSQIIIPLKNGGLVTTYRGAHGGYVLSKPAEEISLLEIVELLEGDLSLVDCVTSPNVCNRITECPTRNIWSKMSSLLKDYLKGVTLASLVTNNELYKESMSNIEN